ncbi:MAG: AsmA family protein [Deltaproteobacteria bacterium]|nr:AsmA family protein [Deltaproteobacteria bacterium]
MKKRILIKVLLITALVLAAGVAAVWTFLSYQVSRLDAFRDDITAAMTNAVDREVTYEQGQAALTLRDGLSIRLTNLVIRDKDRAADLLNVRTAFFRVDLLPLLVDRVTLGELLLDRPRLFLTRDPSGVLNIADLLARQKKSEVLKLRKVTVEDGSLTFTDQAASAGGLTTRFTKVQCRIGEQQFSDASDFKMAAVLQENENQATLALFGTFHPAPSGQSIAEGKWDADIRLNGMDVQHYRPYLQALAPALNPAGRLNMETTISGTFAQFTAKGTLSLNQARIQYSKAFRGTLQPGVLQMDYSLTRGGNHLDLAVGRLVVDRVAVAGRLSIRDMDKEDPVFTAAAATSSFSLAAMHSYIPWQIIPPQIGRFIETHITGGDFRLIEASLKGRKSQIRDIMKPENAGVLSIRAEVKKGIFAFGPKSGTPGFRNISGTLELRNRQFSLRGMEGRFGASPCRLDGGISDFALAGPVVYTAQMTVRPTRDEVLWLLGKDRFANLRFAGDATLVLEGRGPADDFRISARADLTGAAYTYPDVIEKPLHQVTRLSAEMVWTQNAVNISSFAVDLPGGALAGSAIYRFTGQESLSAKIRSGPIDLERASRILPALRKYDPAGTCQIDLAGGRKAPRESGAFFREGSVSFQGVSLKPPGAVKRISGLTGTASFKGDRMETSEIKARIGESEILGKCRVRDFRKPNISCRVSSPQIQAADIGLSGPEGAVVFRQVQGRFTREGDRLHVNRLTLQLGKSTFRFAGDILDFAGPKIAGSLTSPYIHCDDAQSLAALKSSSPGDAASPPAEINLALQVASGVCRDVDFRKLKASLEWKQGILVVDGLEVRVLGGGLTGGGRMEAREGLPNRFAMRFALDRVSLASLSEMLKIGERMVTGDLSLTADLTASGNTMDDLKKTAAGSVQVRAQKGVLKKFSVLSKIFSLLNVAQLFKLRLPDMAADGMPYQTITANVSLKEGVLSSNDFLIDSDAMKMSGAGSIDFIKERVDFIAGVHPLQTLDLIAAKIPIAGWLLTDEGGNLITVHFKATGSWDDPDVRPIPVRSLAKGTFDTFRRLFQLPEKLITDTGDVILGR